MKSGLKFIVERIKILFEFLVSLRIMNVAFVAVMLLLSSCETAPPKINFGKDLCDLCKMTIMDKKFGALAMNNKGKTVKFDSGECMVNYLVIDGKIDVEKFLIINYTVPEELIDATNAYFLQGGEVRSPMGGQLAAFGSKEEAMKFQKELNANLLTWNQVKELDF